MRKISIALLAGLLSLGCLNAQDAKVETNQFTVVKELPITSIKEQGNVLVLLYDWLPRSRTPPYGQARTRPLRHVRGKPQLP